MILHCDQCGFNLPLQANFCPVCGAGAPQVTRIKKDNGNDLENPITKPVFCPYCAEPGELGHLHCTECGAPFFIQPVDDRQFCPWCGKRNAIDARFCYNCNSSFDDWWSMRGRTAQEMGYRGDLIIRETMTSRVYHFVTTDTISFGRGPDNQVSLPCTNISRRHCTLDLQRGLLQDLDSTNGTWLIMEGKKISSIPLALVQDFNLAGLFTFRILRHGYNILVYLSEVLDTIDILNTMLPNTDPDLFEKMQQIYWIGGCLDTQFYIRKIDGRLFFQIQPDEEYYQIKSRDGFFYLITGDSISTNSCKLILKEHNEFWLPKNWQVTIPDKRK